MKPTIHKKAHQQIIKTMTINLTNKLFLDLSTEWSQLVGKYNWYAFTLIEAYFENDKWTGGYELVFTLIGFRLRVRYNTDKALEQFDQWEKEVEKEISKTLDLHDRDTV